MRGLLIKILSVLLFFTGPVVAQNSMHPEGIPDRFIGAEDAKATLIVYSSPTCSHCIHFENTILADIKARFVASGALRVSIRPLPRNPVDTAIYLIAHASGEENQRAILEKYQANYPKLIATNDLEATLREIAAQENIDEAAFDKALQDKAYIHDLEKLKNQAVNQFGIKGTPAFFLNGQQLHYDGKPESLMKVIEKAIGQ